MKDLSRETKGRFYTLRGAFHAVNPMPVQGACASQLRRGRPGSFAIWIGQRHRGAANAQEMPYSHSKGKEKKKVMARGAADLG